MKSFALFALFLVLSFPVLADVVDINNADAATIEKNLSGIGENKAKAIVAYRESNGPFSTVYELAKVKGIGKKTIEKNYDNLSVGKTKK
jgi:competence protein ComEA